MQQLFNHVATKGCFNSFNSSSAIQIDHEKAIKPQSHNSSILISVLSLERDKFEITCVLKFMLLHLAFFYFYLSREANQMLTQMPQKNTNSHRRYLS